MASREHEDGSEDVADFLERIRELGDQRVREDEERARKLEEEILQGRKERQARRAERARSISPTKDSPLSSSFSALQPPDSPTPKSMRNENMDSGSASRSPQLPVRSMDTSMPEPSKPNPPPSSAGLARSGTLSWQQRPTSRGSPTVRSRPLSNTGIDLPMRSPQGSPEAAPVSAKEPTRNQAALMLEGKDPAWFRQTEDRGKGSAAYRRNEPAPELSTASVQLHGLNKPPSAGGVTTHSKESRESRSPSPVRESSSSGFSPHYKATDSAERSHTAVSPMPALSSQRFQPPTQTDNSSARGNSPSRSPTMSPSQGRISPERMDRPSSPTKGLGGFVQSAMMKRSDSVNKRWSAQAAAGLTRGNSVSNNRSESRSPTRNDDSFEGQVKKSPETLPEEGQSRLHQSGERISEPSASTPDNNVEGSSQSGNTRASESKRWSPTKSSWLEAAINKSDAPRPKPAAPPQPSWMAEINKAKQVRSEAGGSKASFDASKDGQQSASPSSPTRSGRVAEPSTDSERAKLTPAGDRSSIDSKSGTQKKWPDASPEKDFRGTLKSRPPPPGDSQNAEPEFKNVFGKLKKTETKNYKAPDEFKDNILRGKAGLNITGGPRPWQKKDEFKDSILKKKQEMREGTSVVNTGNVAPPPLSQVPEAIAKRSNMGAKLPPPETGPKPSLEKPKGPTVGTVPEPIAKKSTIGARPQPTLAATQPTAQASKPAAASDRFAGTSTAKSAKVESASADSLPRSQPSPAGKKPLVEASKQVSRSDSGAAPSTEKLSRVESNSSDTLTRTQSQASSSSTGSKLADRFNPALAGILARGPLGSGNASPSTRSDTPTQMQKSRGAEPKEGAQLTHTTKSRARGPKRRPPKGAAASTNVDSIPTSITETESPTAFKSPGRPGSNFATSPGLSGRRERDDSMSSATGKPKPASPAKSPWSPKKAPLSAKAFAQPQGEPRSPPKSPYSPMKSEPNPNPMASPSLTKSPPPIKPKPSTDERTQAAGTIATSDPSASPAQEQSSFQGSRTSQTYPGSFANASRDLKSPVRGEGPLKIPTSATLPSPSRTDAFAAAADAPAISSPKSQPRSPPPTGKKPTTVSRTRTNESKPESPTAVESPRSKKLSDSKPSRSGASGRSPSSQASQIITEAFGQPLTTVAKNKADVDAQAILQKRHAEEKVKSVKKQVWEVSGDGKKDMVPSHQDHILFDNSIFLCNHTFDSENGKRTTEVHLWPGKEVSPSAIDDAQYFSRNHAKEAGGKLNILEQGKEPARFFEALGGILITRRGTRTSAGNSRYLLGGRRHLGNVAFDELDFSPQSLCTGFPFIVASVDGNDIFLWKGKAAATDLIGCARLIAMDLGAAGNVEEVDEGAEPAKFWKAFGTGAAQVKPWTPSPHASWEGYSTRLFAIDADARPKSSSSFLQWARRASTPGPDESSGLVREVTPFVQSDMMKEGIFVLDAFFELFVVVGRDAFSKLSSFHLALVFAQEYGLLSASVEDRPFIPTGKVVLGGTPEGMRRAFRTWDDRKTPTAKEDKILDLNEALEAFNVDT